MSPAETLVRGRQRAVSPERREFQRDLVAGMRRRDKSIPSKYLYDARGSQLFEEICQLPEYYPTRTEVQIMSERIGEIARFAGPDCAVIELGSGSSTKTRLLLDHFTSIAAYVPVDISASALEQAAAALAESYPELAVVRVCRDFTGVGWRIPQLAETARRRVFFFPGSTIGNFTPSEASAFLRHLRMYCRRGDALLVGADLVKDVSILEAAYNDSAGVTAAFNRNVLERANRELGTDFQAGAFEHLAWFNPEQSRIEMRLVSPRAQTVRLGGSILACFRPGEWITTEYSHKFEVDTFAQLLRGAGFAPVHVWTDRQALFSIHAAEAE